MKTMRVISQSALLQKIVCELPHLREGPHELRVAHANLLSIRKALSRPAFRPR